MQIGLGQAVLVALATYLGVSVWVFGVGYFTVYRPLIAGVLVGLILGDVQRGMAFGAALNAVYLGFVSTGGSLPGDLAIAGYVGTALALASGLDVDAALATFGIPLGILGSTLWLGRMTVGSWIAHWADARAGKGDVRGVAAINLWAGQGMLFVFYALPSFVIVYWGQRGLDGLLALVPARLIEALAVVGGLLPAVGIGLLLRGMGKARLAPYFLVGFVLAIYLGLPVPVIALLGAAAAWLTVKPPQVAAGVIESRPALPRRVLRAAWWRWAMFLHASYNYERLQGLGFAHTLAPVIAYLYKTPVERAAALRRHLTFFNTEPQFGALVPAVVVSMEEERAAGADISDEAIQGVKSGLMGPLAGVGDALFQGVITPLLLALGIDLARRGYVLGPILYAVLISTLVLGASYGFWTLGCRLGRAAVPRILSSGWLQAVTEGASVVGLTVLGALAAITVQVSTPASIRLGGALVGLQPDLLDPILRGLLPLALTLGVWALLRRGVPSIRVIGVLFVLGIDLTYLGLLGQASPPLLSPEWRAFLSGGFHTAALVALYWSVPVLATAWVAAALVAGRSRRVAQGG